VVAAYGPHYTQSHNRYTFPPYGLPPNYAPPLAVPVPTENVNNPIPVCTENHPTQPNQSQAYKSNAREEAREAPVDHTVTGFSPHLGYIAEGHAFSGVPVPNAPRASQYLSLSQPLHFMGGEGPSAVFEKEKTEHMEERLCAIEGEGCYGLADMSELCLVPDVTIPSKFKVPNFDKYKGTACPKNHLRMHCRRMKAYAKDEKLLMHFFQESLVGAAIIWYTNLEPSWIRLWRDLMDAFIRQYQYNSDMAPEKMQLQNLSKRHNESFKEYAQR